MEEFQKELSVFGWFFLLHQNLEKQGIINQRTRIFPGLSFFRFRNLLISVFILSHSGLNRMICNESQGPYSFYSIPESVRDLLFAQLLSSIF